MKFPHREIHWICFFAIFCYTFEHGEVEKKVLLASPRFNSNKSRMVAINPIKTHLHMETVGFSLLAENQLQA